MLCDSNFVQRAELRTASDIAHNKARVCLRGMVVKCLLLRSQRSAEGCSLRPHKLCAAGNNFYEAFSSWTLCLERDTHNADLGIFCARAHL